MKREGSDPSADAKLDCGAATITLDRQIQDRIGDHLRAMYDGLVQQPVPDRFRDLIDRLETPASSDG